MIDILLYGSLDYLTSSMKLLRYFFFQIHLNIRDNKIKMTNKMNEIVKIPGTSWSIKIVRPKDAQNVREVRFLRQKHVEDVYIIEKDGSLEEILLKFKDKHDIIIPETRFENVLVELEQIEYNLPEAETRINASKQSALSQMINLDEMKNKKILILGLANAGKTSIYELIFQRKKWWNIQTQPTHGIKRYTHHTAVRSGYQLFVWDLGGQRKYMNDYHSKPERIFPHTDALVYVVDAYNPEMINEARDEFKWAVENVSKLMPDCEIACLIHKMDQYPNADEQFDNIKNYLLGAFDKSYENISFYSTSIMNDTIFDAWEMIFKSIIPKSKKLDILAQRLKEDTGLYNVLVLEKRTGFPICASSTQFDDVVLVGTVNKLWEYTKILIKDLDLVVLEAVTVRCQNGFLLLDEFNENTVLILISPSLENLNKKENQKLVDQFKGEMNKYI